MAMLATYWFPDSKALGPDSAMAAAVVIALVVATAWRRHPLDRWRSALIGMAPVGLLLYAMEPGSLPGRSFPDGHHYVARILYAAFGFGFALHNFRFVGRAHRINAAIFTLVFSLVLTRLGVDEGVCLLAGDRGDRTEWLVRGAYAIAGAGSAALSILLNRAMIRPYRRGQAGLCAGGYTRSRDGARQGGRANA